MLRLAAWKGSAWSNHGHDAWRRRPTATNCFPVVQISGSSDRHIVNLKAATMKNSTKWLRLVDAKRPLVVLGKGAAYAQADNHIQQFIGAGVESAS